MFAATSARQFRIAKSPESHLSPLRGRDLYGGESDCVRGHEVVIHTIAVAANRQRMIGTVKMTVDADPYPRTTEDRDHPGRFRPSIHGG